MAVMIKVLLFIGCSCGLSFAGDAIGYFRVQGAESSEILSFGARSGKLEWKSASGGVTSTVQRSTDLLDINAWIDYTRVYVASTNASVKIVDFFSPAGMVYVPEGLFDMGDAYAEGAPGERPVHEVFVDGFYSDRGPVTKGLWNEVYQWAVTNGYGFDSTGSSKSADHPVNSISWWDAVKWCNARSEKEGILPAYYLSPLKDASAVYRTGQVDVLNDWVRWDSGYRLPTEAEWERAARGGVDGRRFAWGNSIDHSFANYVANGSAYPYDSSPYTTNTYHPAYSAGVEPYTSPVGSFFQNTYGLSDTAGNIFELCWDRFDSSYYASSPLSNPRGPAMGEVRASRGGCWGFNAFYCRVSARNPVAAGQALDILGFRCILPSLP